MDMWLFYLKTCDFIDNKIFNKITKSSKSSPHNAPKIELKVKHQKYQKKDIYLRKKSSILLIG